MFKHIDSGIAPIATMSSIFNVCKHYTALCQTTGYVQHAAIPSHDSGEQCVGVALDPKRALDSVFAEQLVLMEKSRLVGKNVIQVLAVLHAPANAPPYLCNRRLR